MIRGDLPGVLPVPSLRGERPLYPRTYRRPLMNVCQFTPIPLIAIGIAGIILTKPWDVPDRTRLRIFRSVIIGISVYCFIIGTFAFFDITNSTQDCRTTWANMGLGYFSCIVIPFSIIASIGNLLRYKQLEKLFTLKNKIKFKK